MTTFGDLLDGLAIELDEIRADVGQVITQSRKRMAVLEAQITTLRPFADMELAS